MVRRTAGKVAKDLEKMTADQLPITTAFEVLALRAKSVEGAVVVEVMKESFLEMCSVETRPAS